MKKEVRDGETATKLNLASLADEETRLTKSVNMLRDEEEATNARIGKAIAEGQSRYSARISDLKNEIEGLEARRSDALIPIGKIEEDAKARLAAAILREESVSLREEKVKGRESDLLDGIDSLNEQRDLISEEVSSLERRSRGIAAQESEIEAQAKRVSEEWIKFHKAVNEQNASLAMREAAVRDMAAANDAIREVLDRKENEQRNKDIEIRDRYAQLEKSSAEIFKKTNGDGIC